MYDTSDFRRGLKVEFKNDPWSIIEFQHVNPGKGAAFTRVKIRNLRTQQVLETNIKSGDKLGKPDVEERSMQFLYGDADSYNFMDTNNYEQVSLAKDEVGGAANYLLENSVIKVLFFQGRPIAVETETFVELRVAETQPGIRGDTATGGNKPARMETGLMVNVPLHINEGDVLRIDTREDVYVDRVNKK
jgi:elongation factor P